MPLAFPHADPMLLAAALSLFATLPDSGVPDLPDPLNSAYRALFETSDARKAANASDAYLLAHPNDVAGLELSYVAHFMLGDDALANARFVARSRLGETGRREAMLLEGWHRLHTSASDAQALVESAAALGRVQGALDGNVSQLSADAHRHLGQFELAEEIQKRLGRIGAWQVIGPFENRDNSGFDVQFPPERDVDISATYPGQKGPVGWMHLPGLDRDGRVCLGCVLYPGATGVAYLVTWVESPNETDAWLYGEATDRLKVWVNDRLAVSDDLVRAAPTEPLNPQAGGIHLHRGWNKVLVKSTTQEGTWGAAVRLAKVGGEPLRLTAVAEPRPHQAATDEAWPAGPPDPVLASLGSPSGAGLPADYLLAWRLYDLRSYRRSRAIFDRLRSEHPGAAVYAYGAAMAARRDEDRDYALTGLGEAVRLDPTFSRAFAERSSIYVEMGLTERAEAVARQALDANPESAPGLEAMARILRSRGFYPTARQFLARADRAHPLPSLSDLKAELDIDEGDPTAAVKHFREALVRNRDHWPESLFKLLEQMGQASAAIALYEAKLKHFSLGVYLDEEIARVAIAHRLDAVAMSHLATARHICPQWDAPYRWEGLLAEKQGDTRRALQAYREALVREPDNPSVRDRIELLDPSAALAKRYEVSHDEVMKAAASERAQSRAGASAVVLLDQDLVFMQPDGSSRIFHHQAVKTFDKAGVDRYINLNLGSGKVKILYAASISPAGVEHEISSIDNGVLHFPGLTPGAVTEAWLELDDPSRGEYWSWQKSFGGGDPVVRAEWVLIHPKSKPITFSTRGSHIQQSTEEVGEATANIFRATQLPKIESEPDMPPWVMVREGVFATSIGDWAAVAALVHAVVDGQVNDDATLKAAAEGLIGAAKTPEERIAALSAFVAKKVRYVRADVNLYTWRPHPARRVLEAGYGDCKDKATLFMALARAVGLEARFAILATRSEGTPPAHLPTLWFNHAIAYLPPQPGVRERFIDLTADELSPEFVPFEDQGAQALVIDPSKAGYELKVIPASQAKDATFVIRYHGEVAPDGDGLARVEAVVTGLAAADNRAALRSSRKGALATLANMLFHGGSPQKGEFVEALDDASEPLRVAFEVAVPHAMRASGGHWLMKAGGFPSFEELGASERKLPVALQNPIEWEVHRSWTLPEGYAIERLPPAASLENRFFSLTASYRGSGRELQIETIYRRKVTEVAASDYGALKKAIGEVIAVEDADVVVTAVPPFIRSGR